MKISVLCFYHRIFGVSRTFRRAIYIVGAVSIAWFVASEIEGTLRCIPIRGAWDPLIHAKCYSLEQVAFAMYLINCVNDLVIALLPMFMVRQLQMPPKQKLGVSLIFLLAGL